MKLRVQQPTNKKNKILHLEMSPLKFGMMLFDESLRSSTQFLIDVRVDPGRIARLALDSGSEFGNGRSLCFVDDGRDALFPEYLFDSSQ